MPVSASHQRICVSSSHHGSRFSRIAACLPALDGFELCRRIRQLLPHTPILFFSGADYETDQHRAIEVGANTYVIKPDLSGLLESVTYFIPQAQSAIA